MNKFYIQGDSSKQYNLGNKYYRGEGVEKDGNKAFELYMLAASQGHIKAQFKLGVCYDDGISVPVDKIKAAEWYIKAA